MERREELLKLIVENYIKMAEPIGSKFIVEIGGLEVSGATIRNEMNDLENDGLLTHPHTSAGRIPTVAGYKHYVTNLLEPIQVSKEIKENLDKFAEDQIEIKIKIKNLAKYLSEVLHSAVLVAFGRDNIYYTGFSHLFSQPEFKDYTETVNMSALFDSCEEKVDELYELFGTETKILLGEENPMGSSCGLIGTQLNGNLLTVLGPVRMDYAKSLGIFNHLNNLKI